MGGKIALERAEKIANEVIKRLSPYCERIVIAGSIRRRQPWVHDLDFVLIPSDPWNLYQVMGELGPSKASGEKLRRVMVGNVQLDFYFADETTWGTLFLVKTGSAENNIRLCLRAKDMGWRLHADGSGLFNQYGKRIAGDSEYSIYEALGLPWQRPEERG